jgi:nucleotide-binding universal stress UspA family protein
MTTVARQIPVKRITVTLDASESGRVPLETAVRLAAITGAELEGVFVEDINLMRLPGLPFLREVRPWSLSGEEISTQRMQRELRTLARRAEQMLERAARELGVSWSFQIWRGRAEAASLASAFGADILSLGRVSSLVSSRVFATSRPFISRSREMDTSISVLFSDSEQGVRAVETACSLASDMNAPLTVILPAVEAQELSGLRERAVAALKRHDQVARVVQITGSDAQSLVRAAGTAGMSILVTEADHPLLQQAGLDQCLKRFFCPVLLVR